MTARRLLAATATSTIVAGMALSGASPAFAETYNIDACQSGSYTVLEGDVVNVFWINQNGGGDPVCQDIFPSGVDVVDFSEAPDYCYEVTFGASGILVGERLGLSITTGDVATLGEAVTAFGCGGVPPTPTADAPPIPAWVQAYGRAGANATCEDGWDASWQSWAEPVTGGWVCTRSIPSLG